MLSNSRQNHLSLIRKLWFPCPISYFRLSNIAVESEGNIFHILRCQTSCIGCFSSVAVVSGIWDWFSIVRASLLWLPRFLISLSRSLSVSLASSLLSFKFGLKFLKLSIFIILLLPLEIQGHSQIWVVLQAGLLPRLNRLHRNFWFQTLCPLDPRVNFFNECFGVKILFGLIWVIKTPSNFSFSFRFFLWGTSWTFPTGDLPFVLRSIFSLKWQRDGIHSCFTIA